MSEKERVEAVVHLASRYNGGQPKDNRLWAAGRNAYREALRKKEPPKVAVSAAMAVTGRSRSVVYERAKSGKWKRGIGN